MLKILRFERHVFAAPARHSNGSSGPVLTHVVWNLCGDSLCMQQRKGAALMT